MTLLHLICSSSLELELFCLSSLLLTIFPYFARERVARRLQQCNNVVVQRVHVLHKPLLGRVVNLYVFVFVYELKLLLLTCVEMANKQTNKTPTLPA